MGKGLQTLWCYNRNGCETLLLLTMMSAYPAPFLSFSSPVFVSSLARVRVLGTFSVGGVWSCTRELASYTRRSLLFVTQSHLVKLLVHTIPVYLSTCLPVYLSTCLPVYLSTCLPVCLQHHPPWLRD